MEIDLTKLEKDPMTLSGVGGFVLVDKVTLGVDENKIGLGIKKCTCICHTQQGVMHIVQCCEYPDKNKHIRFKEFQIPEKYRIRK